ncbi:fatty-acyl-CoA synthase [Melghirimyces thermohalophilus]|uniref:Fatty-acyl-CoA synthase n=1 Tax=Melghirimyces thermohalophilus TaxID=1236220 RepID=A0A1G6HSZ6_9BACL|nr:fatty-acyl-CoA synthase [Melghirimyces thermohalophilus]
MIGVLQPLTPMDWKRRAVKYYPNQIAVVDGKKRFTYREFGERVNRLSNALSALGIGKGDHVAVILPNIHEMLECFYGIPQLGAVIVPLNYRLQSEEFDYILNHSDSRVLIVDTEYLPAVEPILDRVPKLEHLILVGEGTTRVSHARYESLLQQVETTEPPVVDIDENDMLSLNYTSGTTSRPKGVMLTHRNNYINAANFLYHLRVQHDDVYLHTLPMFHANGWGGVWSLTAVGGTHVCLRKVDPEVIFQIFEEEKVSLLCGAPKVVSMLVQAAEGKNLSPVQRRMGTAGSPPPAAVIQQAQQILNLEMHHVYGLTEVSPFILYCEWPRKMERLSAEEQATVKARQGVELLFNGETTVMRQDNSGQEVEWNGQEIGEIVARGNVVMKGYYKQPEETAQAIRDGWFHTGDLAVIHPDGYVEILDRLKDIIISGGENISSTEVEGALYKHPAVLDVAVIGVPDETWGEVPKALVIPKPNIPVSEAELITFCRNRLAHYKAPKSVEFVDHLPRTATGKLQKFRLRERYWHEEAKNVR